MSRLVVAVLALALAALPCTAAAQTVPGSMDLQGHVSTAGGQALTGKVTLTVMLFDDEVVPIPFYATEVFDVAVTGGRFSIRLPDVAQDLFATHPFAFVEFSVDGGTPLPRTAVSSVPYAFQAANAGRAASAAQADAAKHADAATKADSAASADAAAVARAVPSGSTAQRPPAPAEGTLRYNSESGVMEVFVAGARGCWMNVNTPPIGASFVQWAGVSEPGAIYPCTTWVSDLQGGEFIRAVGGRSNVAADGTLTGLAQSFATQSFALALTGGIKDAALSTSSALGSG
ncbi:MAG: hypothetical protein FJ087_10585, partial [Deltaproteobacteria bacterium]|nr:hypothetical protein [Deltaproteobacteria bacterium]